MEQKRPIDAMWDDSPVDVTTERSEERRVGKEC